MCLNECVYVGRCMFGRCALSNIKGPRDFLASHSLCSVSLSHTHALSQLFTSFLSLFRLFCAKPSALLSLVFFFSFVSAFVCHSRLPFNPSILPSIVIVNHILIHTHIFALFSFLHCLLLLLLCSFHSFSSPSLVQNPLS